MRRETNKSQQNRVPRAFTLAEVLVTLAIIATLLGIVLMSAKYVQGSRNYSNAKSQMAMLSSAIDRYAESWPKWEIAGVVVADRGWPDFAPIRVFKPIPEGPYNVVPGFNNNEAYNYNVMAGILGANQTLLYCLTAPTGGGPFITERSALDRLDITEFNPTLPAGQLLYPARGGASAVAPQRREVLVDPWGTPYRYLWLYADTNAYRGYLPVDVAAYRAGANKGGVDNPTFFKVNGERKIARGFLLESAGPDGDFGNVWQLKTAISGPDDPDVVKAEDNIVLINP